MGKITKLMTAAGLLAGSVLINAALHAQEDEMPGGMMEDKSGGMMSGDSMSDKESNGHGMMGMMQEMNRMMENCNKMMESHAEAEPKSEASDQPAG